MKLRTILTALSIALVTATAALAEKPTKEVKLGKDGLPKRNLIESAGRTVAVATKPVVAAGVNTTIVGAGLCTIPVIGWVPGVPIILVGSVVYYVGAIPHYVGASISKDPSVEFKFW